MISLMIIPPAQAEALLDVWEEQRDQRSSSQPWMDDDGPEEMVPYAKSPPASRAETDKRHRQPQMRAA